MKHFSKFIKKNSFSFLLCLMCFTLSSYAQQTIKGKVVDQTTKDPLPSASVIIKGTYVGTSTDFDGNFTLTTKHSFPLTLQVSFVGYASKDIEVTSASQQVVIGLEYGNTLNEVVVTSQLREQKLQEVPISVSVLSAQAITDKPTINNIDDVLLDVPGLSGGDTPGGAVYSLRGISSNIFNNSIESSVGIFTDGFFSGRLTAANNEFFDIERIEVLKGPQGTLFGRNTSAGAISITTNSAKSYDDINFAVTMGNEGQQTMDYVANFALSDSFRFRFSGRRQVRDGLVTAKDLTTGKSISLGKVDLVANRLGFVWDIDDTFSADFKVTVTESDRGGSPFVSRANNAITQAFGITTPTDQFSRTTTMSADQFDKSRNVTSTLRLKKTIGENLTIESISAYNFNKLDYQVDGDFTSLDYSLSESLENYKTFNQEFRVLGKSDKVDWLAATNIFYQKSNQENNLISNDQMIDLLFFGGGLGYTNNPFKEETLHVGKIFSGSVFGDVTWHVTDKIDITAGMRFSYDKKEVDFTSKLGNGQFHQTGYLALGLTSPVNLLTLSEGLGAAQNNASKTWTAFQPRLNVSYKLNENTMFFGGYSRGYKPGGFGYYQLTPVDPETNNAFEVGMKHNFNDYKGFINISGYFYDYQDFQVEQFRQNILSIENAADVRSFGVEIETAYNLSQHLQFGGSFAYTNAKFQNFISPVDGDLSGNRATFTPETSFQIYGGYERYFSKVGSFFFNADYSYQGDMFLNQTNSAFSKVPAFGILNAAFGLRNIADSKLEISFFVNNILDKVYITNAREGLAITDQTTNPPTVSGFPYVSRSLPRMFGIKLKINNLLEK